MDFVLRVLHTCGLVSKSHLCMVAEHNQGKILGCLYHRALLLRPCGNKVGKDEHLLWGYIEENIL